MTVNAARAVMMAVLWLVHPMLRWGQRGFYIYAAQRWAGPWRVGI